MFIETLFAKSSVEGFDVHVLDSACPVQSAAARCLPTDSLLACEKAQIPTPEDGWIRLPVDESLRIVDAELAARVDARRGDRRTRYLTSLGRQRGKMPEKAHGSILTGGMLICPPAAAL